MRAKSWTPCRRRGCSRRPPRPSESAAKTTAKICIQRERTARSSSWRATRSSGAAFMALLPAGRTGPKTGHASARRVPPAAPGSASREAAVGVGDRGAKPIGVRQRGRPGVTAGVRRAPTSRGPVIGHVGTTASRGRSGVGRGSRAGSRCRRRTAALRPGPRAARRSAGRRPPSGSTRRRRCAVSSDARARAGRRAGRQQGEEQAADVGRLTGCLHQLAVERRRAALLPRSGR